VGRRCELACRTQGKTGALPQTYPGTQRAWIEFSIEVFQNLLARPGVQLFNDAATTSITAPNDGYLVLECFPTSAWRASGITALPGKGAKPSTAPFHDALCAAYGLPLGNAGPPGHDDLQGLIAALVAAAVIGGPARAVPHGVPATLTDGKGGEAGHRVEGLIWDVAPLAPFERAIGETSGVERQASATTSARRAPATGGARARVTQAVLDQVNRGGVGHAQIVLDGFAAGTKAASVLAKLESDGDEYTLRVGDSHAAWRSHQDDSTMASFETLFAALSERPGDWVEVRGLGLWTGRRPSGVRRARRSASTC
jgi:hypothetical protein